MIDTFSRTFSLILRKPAILLPALITSFLNILAAALLFEQLVEFQVGVGYLLEIPGGNYFNALVLMFQQYFTELSLFIIVGIILGTINLMFVYLFAKFAQEEKLGSAFGFALSKLKEAFMLIIVLSVIGALLTGIYILLVGLGMAWPLIGVPLMIIFALILFYLFLRLVFTIPIMAIKTVNLKKGLQASWQFSQKRVASVFLLFVVVGVINTVLLQIELLVNDNFLAVMGLDELFLEALGFGLPPFLVSLFINIIILTYSGLLIPVYYLKFKGH